MLPFGVVLLFSHYYIKAKKFKPQCSVLLLVLSVATKVVSVSVLTKMMGTHTNAHTQVHAHTHTSRDTLID